MQINKTLYWQILVQNSLSDRNTGGFSGATDFPIVPSLYSLYSMKIMLKSN